MNGPDLFGSLPLTMDDAGRVSDMERTRMASCLDRLRLWIEYLEGRVPAAADLPRHRARHRAAVKAYEALGAVLDLQLDAP